MTHNSARHLEVFFGSLEIALRPMDDAEIVVVDNASTDATVSLVRRFCPTAEVIASTTNVGYAAGINLALDGRRDRPVIVLNPDVQLAPDTLVLLVEAVEAGTAIAVPKMFDQDHRLQWSLRREPTPVRAWAETLFGGKAAGRLGLGEYVTDPRSYSGPTVADWATGAVVAISVACLQQLPTWDESFFLYSEETDYMLRARDAGLTTELVPDAHAIHVGGEQSESPPLWTLAAANRVRLHRRRHASVSAILFYAAIVAREFRRAITGDRCSRFALQWLIGPNGRQLLTRRGALRTAELPAWSIR